MPFPFVEPSDGNICLDLLAVSTLPTLDLRLFLDLEVDEEEEEVRNESGEDLENDVDVVVDDDEASAGRSLRISRPNSSASSSYSPPLAQVLHASRRVRTSQHWSPYAECTLKLPEIFSYWPSL